MNYSAYSLWKIEDLRLSARAKKALINYGLTTVEKTLLYLQNDWEFIGLLEGVGTKTVEEIKTFFTSEIDLDGFYNHHKALVIYNVDLVLMRKIKIFTQKQYQEAELKKMCSGYNEVLVKRLYVQMAAYNIFPRLDMDNYMFQLMLPEHLEKKFEKWFITGITDIYNEDYQNLFAVGLINYPELQILNQSLAKRGLDPIHIKFAKKDFINPALDAVLSMSYKELPVSNRLKHGLQRADLYNVRLILLTVQNNFEGTSIRHIGPALLKELKKILMSYLDIERFYTEIGAISTLNLPNKFNEFLVKHKIFTIGQLKEYSYVELLYLGENYQFHRELYSYLSHSGLALRSDRSIPLYVLNISTKLLVRLDRAGFQTTNDIYTVLGMKKMPIRLKREELTELNNALAQSGMKEILAI